jgi:hypothetical protein
LLYPGRLIGQLILLKLDEKDKARRKLSGSYLGPVYPEPPVFNDPEEDLAAIGVPKSDFKRPGAAWFKPPGST